MSFTIQSGGLLIATGFHYLFIYLHEYSHLCCFRAMSQSMSRVFLRELKSLDLMSYLAKKNEFIINVKRDEYFSRWQLIVISVHHPVKLTSRPSLVRKVWF